MPLRRIAFITSLVLSALCLIAGYAAARMWAGCGLAALTAVGWLQARRSPGSGLAGLCLFSSVALAATGVLLAGAWPLGMTCAAGFALASWDLILLEEALKDGSSSLQTRRHENRHVQVLALALAGGLTLAGLGGMLKLEIPFALMMLCVALVLFGFERTWSSLKRRG